MYKELTKRKKYIDMKDYLIALYLYARLIKFKNVPLSRNLAYMVEKPQV